MRWTIAVLSAFLVGACAQQPAPATAPTAPTQAQAPAPSSPAPRDQLIAVIRDGRMVLVDLNGRDIAMSSERIYQPAGAGGNRAAWVGSDGVLRALERDGRTHELQTLARVADVQLSPDGTQWLWSDQRDNTADGTTRSILHLSGEGGKDTVLADVTEPFHALAPYRWDSAGALLWHAPRGVGGYIPFYQASGTVELLEIPNGRIGKRIDTPQGCALDARAADGTIACESRTDTGVSLSILRPDGSGSTLRLPPPQFYLAGNLSFRPGSPATTAVIGGAAGAGPQGEKYSAALIDVVRGSMSQFGPEGFAPGRGDWAWLDDGSVVGFGTTANHDFDVYVVAPSGTARRVTSGTPVGVLK